MRQFAAWTGIIRNQSSIFSSRNFPVNLPIIDEHLLAIDVESVHRRPIIGMCLPSQIADAALPIDIPGMIGIDIALGPDGSRIQRRTRDGINKIAVESRDEVTAIIGFAVLGITRDE